MDGDPSRGQQPPRDRLPPSHNPPYHSNGPSRDDALRMRPQLDDLRRYSRSDLEPPPPHSRGSVTWSDRAPSAGSYIMHEAPPPPRPNYPYTRPLDAVSTRPGPYPSSDLPHPPRSNRPDEYYAAHRSASNVMQDGNTMSSRPPPHRLARFEEEALRRESRGMHLSESRDPYGPPRRLSDDPKSRSDAYAEPPFYPSRPPVGHPSADPRAEPPHSRIRSPAPMHPGYPGAAPSRRISNPSPPYPGDSPDASLHRDKRARLDLYTERSQPGADAALRPPPLRTSSSYRSMASASSEWAEHPGPGERRPRDPMEPSSHSDMGGKVARSLEWAEAERGHLSRRTSAISHHTLESGNGQSSETLSNNAQSSKVKRRKRAVLSCTECKQRKIKCDRNVPNCGSCVRRGVAHLCRWGDERDFLPAAPASNITPSNAALMARIAQLESQVRVLQSSPSSPSAIHEVAPSDRSLGQHLTDKYGPASTSSGERSSRFSARSSLQNPPDFTSRERNASDVKHKVGTSSARGAYDRLQEEEIEEDSEQSGDSEDAESGAENAGDLMHALARGTSLKKESRRGPSRDGAQMPADIASVASADAKPSVNGSNLDARGPRDGQGDDAALTKVRRSSAMSVVDLTSMAMSDIFAANLQGKDDQSVRDHLLAALDLLPPRHKTEALIDLYLREAEPIIDSIHKPSFLQQLKQFWSTLDALKSADPKASPAPPLPDLQFSALLLAVCEGACEYMTPNEVLESEIAKSRSSINDQLVLMSRTCLALLGRGQFVRYPNIWGLQAIIAMRHFCFNRDHREEYTVLFTMAIKAAECLGLHRLGSAVKDEERWAEEKQRRMQGTSEGKDAASANTHRWKMLTSTQVQDGFETESEGEDLDPDRSGRPDLNAMWLPRGSKRRQWEVAATKRYKEGSRVSRETGRKVWFAFATVDWLCAAHFDRCYYCKDEMFTTQSPQNIDDCDLTDSDSAHPDDTKDAGRPYRSSPFLDKIRASNLPTTNSFIPIYIEICHTVRSIADAQNHGDESYETVLAIEARFREILRSLPRFFRLDGESEYDPEVHRLHRERPYLSLQRAVIHEYVHHRLLKLHRLYMSRGYWNAKYIHSTRTCVESARVVIGVLRALDSTGCRGQRYWIFKFNIFHAVLALQVDLLYLARQPVNREILDKRADVVAGLKMLHARTDVEGRNPLLASSLKVIKVLREEERARRAKNDAANTETSGGSELHGTSSPSDSTASSKKNKPREWTGASESTGDLAEHLERRIKETWYTVDADNLRVRAEANSDIAAEGRSPDEVPKRLGAFSRTPSTEDGSSLHTADADSRLRGFTREAASGPDGDLAALKGRPLKDQDKRDTELDDYLKLLSSYQNPDDAPDGGHFFDVLDDLVFENDSADKLVFGTTAVRPPLTSELSPALPEAWNVQRGDLLRGAVDLAAAGAGFDAFTAA